ncbi:MAG: NAD(P)H-hydrate dehydratase [Chloroflexi bacterium]|nr:NAD(P)H-hydrate dehydratase [Chloroflexota bacterium]
MKLVTANQMRLLEQRADRSGNTFAMMMERAGKAVADAILARGSRDRRVLVLVGPGNNGGDGLVCGRFLRDAGASVALYLWKRKTEGDDANFLMCVERGIPVTHAEDDKDFAALRDLLARSDVIVDALLGTGVTRPIEGLLKEMLAVVQAAREKKETREIKEIVPASRVSNPASSLVVAVDLPSGLNPDTGALDPSAVPADLTVTFAFPKVGQLLFPGAGAVGELLVADIGIPAEWASDVTLEVASAEGVAARLPARPQNSHKGTYGKAMICAGSANYVGAAYLAGSAATRAGAGLVTLALARSIQPMVAAAAHETTYVPLPDDNGALTPEAIEPLVNALGDYDTLLIGCGFGRNPKTIRFVQELLVRMTNPFAPLVIDADALFALSQTPDWWTRLAPNTAILTPHPGEMSTLCRLATGAIQSDRVNVAQRFAVEWRQIVVLKGAHSVVAAPDGRVTLVPFATPALATAGTGDVLAGTIVALLAQKLAPFDAAVAGAYLHGLAGKIAEEEIGRAGAIAGDLLPRLPRAIRKVWEYGSVGATPTLPYSHTPTLNA